MGCPSAMAPPFTLTMSGFHLSSLPTARNWAAKASLAPMRSREPWIDLIVGGDTCERRKPDPQPLLFACGSLGFAAAEALMVGDSINDVGAARAAGIPVVCVPYGYNEGRDPRTLDCDAMVETLAELPALVSCP